MKISPVSEPIRVSEIAPRSADVPVPKKEANGPEPPLRASTALASMTEESAAMGEADHAARLKSVALALQSSRYSLDIMRIAEALARQ